MRAIARWRIPPRTHKAVGVSASGSKRPSRAGSDGRSSSIVSAYSLFGLAGTVVWIQLEFEHDVRSSQEMGLSRCMFLEVLRAATGANS
jgi:hypothetical protein